MKIPPPAEEVLPLNRACDLLIFGWLGTLTDSGGSSARNLAVAPSFLPPPPNSPADCEASSAGWSDPNNDFPNNMLGGGFVNMEGTDGWTGGSSLSSKTGVLGLVPAVLATVPWGDPNSPEPPWNSPLLGWLLVSVEETGFPKRDLPGSEGGFPNNGAADAVPNIVDPAPAP